MPTLRLAYKREAGDGTEERKENMMMRYKPQEVKIEERIRKKKIKKG